LIQRHRQAAHRPPRNESVKIVAALAPSARLAIGISAPSVFQLVR
jgi:hypothetical protein